MATVRQSVDLSLSRAEALRECQRAVADMSWQVLNQTDREMTCKEFYTKVQVWSGTPMRPATINLVLSPSAGRTAVTVTADLSGFTSKHLQGIVSIFCNRLLAAQPPDRDPLATSLPDDSVVVRLEHLASLHASGALTDLEFRTAKERILKGE
jgi:hypothetical protein